MALNKLYLCIIVPAAIMTVAILIIGFVAPHSWWGDYDKPGLSTMDYIFSSIGGLYSLYFLILVAIDRFKDRPSRKIILSVI